MRTTENPARFSRNQMEQENGGQEDKARFGFYFPIFLSTIFLWESSDRLPLINGDERR